MGPKCLFYNSVQRWQRSLLKKPFDSRTLKRRYSQKSEYICIQTWECLWGYTDAAACDEIMILSQVTFATNLPGWCTKQMSARQIFLTLKAVISITSLYRLSLLLWIDNLTLEICNYVWIFSFEELQIKFSHQNLSWTYTNFLLIFSHAKTKTKAYFCSTSNISVNYQI